LWGKTLPGLNSITDRIRYYSFYCWFFGWYAKTIGNENPREQRRYIRRAEYLLALVAAKLHLIGVPGITEAEKNVSKNLTIYSLKEGTGEGRKTFENTYWQNPGGIFGQNYVSSMRQMGLLRDKEENTRLYIRTSFEKEDVISGKDLEMAFENNLATKSKQIFVKSLLNGEITDDELNSISSDLNMRTIPAGTMENELLVKMLMSKDEPLNTNNTFFRKKTLLLYLDLIQERKNSISVMDMMAYAYKQQGKVNDEQNETLTGWYYYQLDQCWHMVSTGGLASFLQDLKQKSEGSWYVESQQIEELSDSVAEALKAEFTLKKDAVLFSLPVLEEDEITLANRARRETHVKAFMLHFLLLRKLIHKNADSVLYLTSYAKSHQLTSTSNFVAVYADITKKAELSLKNFISYFIQKYIINRHQFVALRKMNDTQSTEKFLREDGLIRFIDNISYEFSGQRLGTLIQFIEDLGLLNKSKDGLSESGLALKEKNTMII